MPTSPCMFCGVHPCECTGRKKMSGLSRKPLPKKEPVAKPTEARKPEPRQLKSQPPQPAPSIKRERTLDPELEQVLRTLDYHDMLHPDEQKKYAQYLHIPKTTGKLIKLEEGGDDGIDDEG